MDGRSNGCAPTTTRAEAPAGLGGTAAGAGGDRGRVCNGSFYDSTVNSDPQGEFQLDEWKRTTAILAAAASNSGLPGAGIAHRW